MVICSMKCALWGTCKEREIKQKCIYDLGIPEAEDEGDDFIERLTY